MVICVSMCMCDLKLSKICSQNQLYTSLNTVFSAECNNRQWLEVCQARYGLSKQFALRKFALSLFLWPIKIKSTNKCKITSRAWIECGRAHSTMCYTSSFFTLASPLETCVYLKFVLLHWTYNIVNMQFSHFRLMLFRFIIGYGILWPPCHSDHFIFGFYSIHQNHPKRSCWAQMSAWIEL